jgi:hypothetical protein
MNKKLLVILALLGSVTLLFGADTPRRSIFDPAPSKSKEEKKPVKHGAFYVCDSDTPTRNFNLRSKAELVPKPPTQPKSDGKKCVIRTSSAITQRSTSLSPKKPTTDKPKSNGTAIHRASASFRSNGETKPVRQTSSATTQRSISLSPKKPTTDKPKSNGTAIHRASASFRSDGETKPVCQTSSATTQRSTLVSPQRPVRLKFGSKEAQKKASTVESPQRPVGKEYVPLNMESIDQAPKEIRKFFGIKNKKEVDTTTTITQLPSKSGKQRFPSAKSVNQILPGLRQRSTVIPVAAPKKEDLLEKIELPLENPLLTHRLPKRVIDQSATTDRLRELYRTNKIMELYTQLLIAYKTISGDLNYSSNTPLEEIQLSAATNRHAFSIWEKAQNEQQYIEKQTWSVREKESRKKESIERETSMLQKLYAQESVKALKVLTAARTAQYVEDLRTIATSRSEDPSPSPKTILKRSPGSSSRASSGSVTPVRFGRNYTKKFSKDDIVTPDYVSTVKDKIEDGRRSAAF